MNHKNLKRRFGTPDTQPYYHQLDLRQIDDLDDEAFAYLVKGVKGVNMLDLNETDISNKSIELISQMEYVNEIRAKGCHSLDDGCVPFLNKIPGLRLLHLRYTEVTIDGLLQLTNLQNLTTLLFSASDAQGIEEKLLQLKYQHPHCELLMDGRLYSVKAISFFVFALQKRPYPVRLKIKDEALDTSFSPQLLQDAAGNLQTTLQGPYPMDAIEWIEINLENAPGKNDAEPAGQNSHAEDLIRLLDYLHFPYLQEDCIISAYLVDAEV